MTDPDRATIAIDPPGVLAASPRLFELLGAATEMRFVPSRPGTSPRGLIACGAANDQLIVSAAARAVKVAVLSLPAPVAPTDVTFAMGLTVPSTLRRAVFSAQHSITSLSPDPDGVVLARSPAGPVWSRARDGSIVRIGAPLPPARTTDVLRVLLGPDNRSHAFVVIALLEFLRSIEHARWEPAPMRATFQFDDPNLRSRRYGHIDYRRLIEHADCHGYHASIAMIPLDTRHPAPATVELFRAHGDRVSLVMHGNDHRRQELLRTDRYDAALAVGTQALQRIKRFEARTGLSVGRVMIPPHGMSSREVCAALAALRYDCLCSLHPTPWTEHPPPALPLAGFTPATFVDGCGVIPRVPLGDAPAELAIRAYLGQPLVLYGHHDDLADGYGVLEEVAGRVNRLGPVRWGPLASIARTNNQLRIVGHTAEILPWANRLDVRLPSGTSRIRVLTPPHAAPGWLGIRSWTLLGEPSGRRHELGESATAEGSEIVSIRLEPVAAPRPADADHLTRPHPLVWARRRAAELRDRTAPLARIVTRGPASS